MWIAPALRVHRGRRLAAWLPSAAGRLRRAGAVVRLAGHRLVDQPAAAPARSALERRAVRRTAQLARRTWAFFETFVTAEDHFLPPDNMQELPEQRVAHRTSPTNIGLSLLANLAARDFGYLTERQLIERTAPPSTRWTAGALPRALLNWYDTRSLQPLRPAYVSSVDSGNLAGHLLTLRAGLLLLAERRRSGALFDGLRDTLAVAASSRGGDRRWPPCCASTRLLDTPRRWCRARPIRRPSTSCAARQIATGGRTAAPAAEPCEADAAARLGRSAQRRRRGRCELEPCAGGRPGAPWTVGAARAAGAARLPSAPARWPRWTTLPLRPGRHLLTIGYNVGRHRRDSATTTCSPRGAPTTSSRSRRRRLPQESWFALGSPAPWTAAVLLSWSGSMFEYLMPMLVMPSYENTLLDQAVRGAVQRQIHYGRSAACPGACRSRATTSPTRTSTTSTAPSACRAGLQRGLAEDLVVAPYATVMALMVDPPPRCRTCTGWPARRRRHLRLLRSDRLHALAPAARRDARRRALLHGAPPGHEPAGAGARAARRADAAALRVRAAAARHAAAAAGAHPAAIASTRSPPNRPRTAATWPAPRRPCA
jgi:hypothetical protein